jgi:hypothetical protein
MVNNWLLFVKEMIKKHPGKKLKSVLKLASGEWKKQKKNISDSVTTITGKLTRSSKKKGSKKKGSKKKGSKKKGSKKKGSKKKGSKKKGSKKKGSKKKRRGSKKKQKGGFVTSLSSAPFASSPGAPGAAPGAHPGAAPGAAPGGTQGVTEGMGFSEFKKSKNFTMKGI